MRFLQLIAPVVGLLSIVNAGTEDVVWTTVVTTKYETYCPYPTTFWYKNVTYTATTPCTITVTNCPCTISYYKPPPVYTHPPVYHNKTTTTTCPEDITKTFHHKPTTKLAGVTYTTHHPTPVGPTTKPPPVVITAAADMLRPMAAGALALAGMAAALF